MRVRRHSIPLEESCRPVGLAVCPTHRSRAGGMSASGDRAALQTAAGRRGQDIVGCDDGQFPDGSRGCLAPKPKKLVIRPTGPKVKENKRNTGLRFKYRNTAAPFQVSSLNDILCILCGFAYIWTLGFRAPFNTIFCI